MKRLYVSYLLTSSRLESKLHERKGSGISEFDKFFSQCLVLFQADPKPKYKTGPGSISIATPSFGPSCLPFQVPISGADSFHHSPNMCHEP